MTMFIKKSAALVSGLAMLAGLVATQEAQAMPGFARQTGMACLSCHFQSFPTLNSFGRSFKEQGYTMVGTQALVEGEELSLPSTLNVGFIGKFRYKVQDSKVVNGRGAFQWPDEAALLLGGRAAEKVGFLAEMNMAAKDAASGSTETNLANAKFHFNVTDNFATVLFGTADQGAGYGFETLSSGLERLMRPIEAVDGMSSAKVLGLNTAATGLAFVYHTDMFFINYTHFAPAWNGGVNDVNANLAGGLGHYLRAAYTPNIGGWDTGFGAALFSGKVKTGAKGAAETVLVTDGMELDAQAQGNISDSVTLGLYANYSKVPKKTAGTNETLVFNNDAAKDNTAAGLLAKLGVGNWKPFVAYRTSEIAGAKENVTTVGTQYDIAQNLEFEAFRYNSDVKANSYSMLMMFVGF